MTDIALVGEAWGAEEEKQRSPFVGAAGYELTRLLEEAGIRRADCFITNVFNLRPENNDITTLCSTKRESTTGLPPLSGGKYLRSEYVPEIDRLFSELRDVRPNITVALGNTACWALLHNSGISKIRGTVAKGVTGLKTLATFHPAAILRDWSLRHVTILDLMKAKRESAFPEIRRPARTVFIPETLADLDTFYDEHLRNCKRLSFDIETSGIQISCIGFAPSPLVALTIPFIDPRTKDRSYWPSIGDELRAWGFVRKVLGSPVRKVAQNGVFDCSFLWKRYGIAVRNMEDDCMLLHHALQPESLKGLGFLGSVYTNESSWKLMTRHETIKRDE